MIEREPTVKSVAILYGAAHMPDMAEQLVALGPGYEEVDTRWDAAISVDLAKSSLSERDRKSIRRSMRLALAQIKRKARLAREAQERDEAGETGGAKPAGDYFLTASAVANTMQNKTLAASQSD